MQGTRSGSSGLLFAGSFRVQNRQEGRSGGEGAHASVVGDARPCCLPHLWVRGDSSEGVG